MKANLFLRWLLIVLLISIVTSKKEAVDFTYAEL